jgi:signal transduction histidine kinase
MTDARPKTDMKPGPQAPGLDPAVDKEKKINLGAGDCAATEADSFFRQVNIEFLLHELKDPVSIIETGVRMLLERQGASGPLSQTQERTLTRILRNANKTREMLNELLEVGRAENACFNCRAFNPIDLLQQKLLEVIEKNDPELFEEIKHAPDQTGCIASLAKKGIRIDISPSAEGMTMLQDELKFSQIVGNLLKNGVYYRRRQLLVHLSCQHDRISISVRDDGPGIAPEHHEEIFKRYKQVMASAGVARTGHGLGLAVSRIMARSMGGDIIIESELGYGALFKFILPMSPS